MNTPSPLVPQGTLPTRGKSTFFFKVLMVISFHVVVIGGMLLQGCKDTTKDASATPPPATDQTAAATSPSDTLPPVATPTSVSNAQVAAQNNAPIAQPPTSPAPAITSTPPQNLPPLTQSAAPIANNAPTAPTTDAKEYTIAAHDTLGAIAHRNGISLKTLMEANPGVNPKKLQIGQKVQIPAGTGAVASTGNAPAIVDPAAPASAAGDSGVYVVKSGDTLSKIAKLNHTSYKKIMALNELKTTSIRVGQKLKLPGAKSATTESATAPAPASPVVPLQTTPASSTTAAAAPTSAAN